MTDPATNDARFGIRVTLPDGDPFNQLLDDNWQTTHWYATAVARDLAMSDMRREHEYSRQGDAPALVFEAVEQDTAES